MTATEINLFRILASCGLFGFLLKYAMDVEKYIQERIYNPEQILTPIAHFFPEEVAETINHEKNHAFSDPEKSTKGGEFGYSAVLIKLPNGLVMASWVAWYQPWGEREPEDMMEIAKAPGRSKMSDQDISIFNQAWNEWMVRLSEKQEEEGEENPISILEVIPGTEDENEDDYKIRAEIIIKFGQKLAEMSQKGELPPMDELIEKDFAEIYVKHKEEFDKAYDQAEKEFEEEKNEEGSTDEENGHGIIFVAAVSEQITVEDYQKLPLAV